MANDGKVTVAPDGGWGWVVMLSSFMISVLVDGLCLSVGVYFNDFLVYFGGTKSETAWVLSVLNGSYLIVGPVVSSLSNRFGCRIVTIAGAWLCAIAIFVSTFTSSLGAFILIFGVFGGIGLGFMYLPAIVMVGYYFDKKRAMATGIAVCGSGIGTFIFAPLIQYLMNLYSWKGAMWISAAVVSHGAIFGAFYRPLRLEKDSSRDSSHSVLNFQGESCSSYSQNFDNRNASTFSRVLIDDPSCTVTQSSGSVKSEGERDKLNSFHPHLQPKGGSDLFSVQPNRGKDIIRKIRSAHERGERYQSPSNENTTVPRSAVRCKSWDVTVNKNLTDRQNDDVSGSSSRAARLAKSHDMMPKSNFFETKEKDTVPPLYRKDILYSGSLSYLSEKLKSRSLEDFMHSMLEISDEDVGSLRKKKRNAVVRSLKRYVDFSLLKSPTFLLYCAASLLSMIGFFVPFAYLPALAKKLSMSGEKAALLISIIGISNTVSRVVVGIISDRPWANCIIINNAALLLSGVATAMVPFLFSYLLLSLFSVVFGICIAAFISLRSIIMVELMGIEKLTTSFGLVIMCQGFTAFVGSPIAGFLSDLTGTYDAAFYLAGAALAVSGILCLPLRILSRWEANRKDSKHTIVEMLPMVDAKEKNQTQEIRLSEMHVNKT